MDNTTFKKIKILQAANIIGYDIDEFSPAFVYGINTSFEKYCEELYKKELEQLKNDRINQIKYQLLAKQV